MVNVSRNALSTLTIGLSVVLYVGVAVARQAVQPNAEIDNAKELTQADVPLLMELGQAISSFEIEQYRRILQLSEPQSHFLNSLFSTYEQQIRQIRGEMMPTIIAPAVESVQRERDGLMDYVAADLYAEFMEQQIKMARKMERADEALLMQLLSVLAEEQEARFSRVQQLRQRMRCAMVARVVPGAGFDLSDFIFRNAADEVISDDVDQLLAEYESHFAQLITQLNRTRFLNSAKEMENAAGLQFRSNGERIPRNTEESRAASAQWRAQSVALRSRPAEIQRRMADLNKMYFKSLCDLLPPKLNQKVQAHYRMHYPAVFPDPLEPRALYEKTLAVVEPDTREQLNIVWEQYRAIYESLCDKMVEEVDDWRVEWSKVLSTDWKEPYYPRMRRLRDVRWESSIRFVRQMKGMLSSEVLEALQRDFEAYEQLAVDMQTDAAADKYPPL